MQPLSASPLRTLHNSNGPKKRILPDPLELQGLTMELAEPTMTAGTTSSSSTAGTMMHSAIRSAAPSPEPQKGLENDHDTIWVRAPVLHEPQFLSAETDSVARTKV